MKKIISLCVLLVFAWLSANVFASVDLASWSAVRNPEAVPKAPPVVTQSEIPRSIELLKKGDIKKGLSSVNPVIGKKKAAASKVASVKDLAGEWVQTYMTMINSGADGGKGVTIETIDGEASKVKIMNFFDTGFSVVADVDLASKKISIPNQKVYNSGNYGWLDIAVVHVQNNKAVIDRENPVEGTINDDGTISITSYWGIFVVEGNNADAYMGLFYNTELERANATMSQKKLVAASATNPEITYTDISYNVIAEQTSVNTLSVKNFGNYGMTVELILNRDLTSTIETQVGRQDAVNGAFMTCGITYKEDGSGLNTKINTIITEKATDKRTITWKDWTMINTKYYLGIFVEGKITTTSDIDYPTLSVSDFEGEGTEASPYLIKSLDHFILLSDKVNEVAEEDYESVSSNGVKYTRVFLGKHFRMENDIDMEGYRFTPIGKDWSHHFAGSFDGGNHTIRGLNISTGAEGYAALFGRTDTTTVIKNLWVENPVVKAQNYYAAPIVGWSLGSIENCHVIGADVYNEGGIAGGLAGVSEVIKNCTVVKSEVIGLGGHTGGLVGQLMKLIENSSATETNVTGYGAEGAPVGGLTGSIYEGSAYNCYFSGTVDTYSRRGSNLQVGGIGGFLYKGSIDRCFSVGTIMGYDTNAKVGGIVGTLQGSLTNSYSIGRISDISSRYTGGLTGHVSVYEDAEKNLVQSVVKNCYTSTFVSAETYMYKPETEVRETLGTINPDERVNPTIENIFFDKNITNLTSTKYGTTTAELTKASGIAGFDASVWNFADGQYPRLKGIDDNEAAYMGASVLDFPEGSTISKVYADTELHPLGSTSYKLYKEGRLYDEGHYSLIENNRKLKLKEDFGTDTLFINNGDVSYYYFVKAAPMPYDGIGTEDDPFLLKTKQDLIKLSEITTVKNQLFPETYFKIANDIDLEHDPAFLGICANTDLAANQFAGVIDGGGYYIHNMYFNSVVWETEPTDGWTKDGDPETQKCSSYKGFVGRLGAVGVVKNLNIADDAKLLFWGTSGAIVGYNYGLVENCKNFADVTGVSCWIGGVSGQNVGSGRIVNCYNAGDVVSGYMNAGGIVGTNYGTIENSANAGDISVKSISKFIEPGEAKLKMAGGIAGNSSGAVYRNVLNVGTVYAEYSSAGGITGSLTKTTSTSYAGSNDMYNAINYGQVSTNNPTLVGGLGGASGTQGKLQNNYWDAQILPLKANGNTDYEGMTGVETSVLTSGKALDGFDASLWDFTAGQYPVLKQFADEDLLAKARMVVVKMPAGITAKDLNKDAELVAVDGLSWSLKQGKVFTLSGNMVKSPASVKELTSDTIVAKFGGYEKQIQISRIPAVPLAGSGTSEDPYKISSADDWNAVSDYMTTIAETFEGEFFKVTSDIDFSDKEFKILAADGATYWQATLDGDGKTISGVKFTTDKTGLGAIRIVGANGVVKNLTISGDFTTAYASTGGFTGEVYGTLDNCINAINVTSTKGNGVSGFGKLYSTARLTDCINKGTITGIGTNIAGIAADAAEGVVLVGCGNEGKIVNNKKGSYTAGLIGSAYPVRLEECYNKGVIEITDVKNTKNVGGLIGYATASSSSTQKMELVKCYNTASVSGCAIIAGLIAGVNASTSVSNPILMTECYNTGDIIVLSDKNQSSSPTAGLSAFYTPGSVFKDCWNSGSVMSPNTYAAGITAYNKLTPKADSPVSITGCYNTGYIVASGNQGGGIIAYVSDYVTVDDCHNTGSIEGGFGLGGIAARFDGEGSYLKNSWNSGEVTTSTYRAGGIAGYSFEGTMENCFNIGNISSTSTAEKNNYGVGGLAGEGGNTFINCYNMGTVSGISQVGGLIGLPRKNVTQMLRCYNAGKVVAEADTCGALIGADLSNGRVWTVDNKVEGCYYVTDNGETGNNNSVGTGVTTAALAKANMGEGWTNGDGYTLPIPATMAAVPQALVNAVTVVFSDGDTKDRVTRDFFVGAPEGVAWTASVSDITFSGTDAKFGKAAFKGDVVLTATAGELSRTFEISCDKADSGVDGIASGRTVVGEVWYNASGVRIPKPTSHNGAVYLVIRTYDDGSIETLKVFNTK